MYHFCYWQRPRSEDVWPMRNEAAYMPTVTHRMCAIRQSLLTRTLNFTYQITKTTLDWPWSLNINRPSYCWSAQKYKYAYSPENGKHVGWKSTQKRGTTGCYGNNTIASCCEFNILPNAFFVYGWYFATDGPDQIWLPSQISQLWVTRLYFNINTQVLLNRGQYKSQRQRDSSDVLGGDLRKGRQNNRRRATIWRC